MKRPVHYKVVLCAILTIGVLEAVALSNGVNGTIYMVVVACIAGLAGKVMPQWRLK